jgi:hypothetical protein
MPHRLKTPRWYTKRKIQIENMDIWNVAFPEGAEIDLNTAWKVFWKTAGAMYGKSGFRVDNIDARAPEKVSYGIWWSSSVFGATPFAHTVDSKTLGTDKRCLYNPLLQHDVHGRESWEDEMFWYQLKYVDHDGEKEQLIVNYIQWAVDRCAQDLAMDNSSYFKFKLFVAADTYCTVPSLFIDGDWRTMLRRHLRQRREYVVDDIYEQQIEEVLGWRSTTNYKPRDRSGVLSMHNASAVSFVPSMLTKDSSISNISGLKWRKRFYEGDYVAYQLACLLWCDWILKSLRELLLLDSPYNDGNTLLFNYSKSTLVPRHALLGTPSERANAIRYHLFQALPVRPLDYEF